jgi:spore coat protein H
VFSRSNLIHLNITISSNELADLRVYPRRYVPVLVVEGSNQWSQVGLHLKGGIGSGQVIEKKPSLSLHFGRFSKTSSFYGIQRWQLNNSSQDPTYLNEVVASQIFRDAGMASSRCTHARVSMNGRDLGIYVMREGVDEKLLAQFFENPKGDIYQGGYTKDVTAPLTLSEDDRKTEFDFGELRNGFEIQDAELRLEAVSRFVDIGAFARYLALEVLTCHSDGYAFAVNNYRLFVQRSEDDGPTANRNRLYFLPHGMDVMFSQPKAPILPCVAGKMAKTLLASNSGRTTYWRTFGQVFTNCFVPTTLSNRVELFRAKLRPEFATMGSEVVSRQIELEEQFLANVLQRYQHLAAYLEQERVDVPVPSLQPGQTIPLPIDRWQPHEQFGDSFMFKTNRAAGKAPTGLAIISQATRYSAGGTWRQRIKLPRGEYRLEGTAEFLFTSQLAQMVPPNLFCERTNGERSIFAFSDTMVGAFPTASPDFKIRSDYEEVDLAVGFSGLRVGLLFHADTLKLRCLGGPSVH